MSSLRRPAATLAAPRPAPWSFPGWPLPSKPAGSTRVRPFPESREPAPHGVNGGPLCPKGAPLPVFVAVARGGGESASAVPTSAPTGDSDLAGVALWGSGATSAGTPVYARTSAVPLPDELVALFEDPADCAPLAIVPPVS